VSKNMKWLREHRAEYRGKWVALRDGVLLDADESIVRLATRVSIEHGVEFPSREVLVTHGGDAGEEWNTASLPAPD
jgi:hypothetical protein